MEDVELVIKMPKKDYLTYSKLSEKEINELSYYERIIANGTPLTPDILTDLLMEKRIRGELKQDISYSKDIIDNVRCKLTVNIIDRRPCYCGTELREVWRESEE